MSPPCISVLMPVFNGEKYLKESIDSIIRQTFSDFEFIIIDDGSTDNTYSIIEQYGKKDARIRSYCNSSNLGVAVSLNKGLELARSSLIARMDADDIALPHRLQTQFEFMRKHPEVTICGGYMQAYEKSYKIWLPPLAHEEIKALMFFINPLFHPTIMFRKQEILNSQGYNASFSGAEDYEIWQRLSEYSTIHFANIPKHLMVYRTHPDVERRAYKIRQKELTDLVRNKYLEQIGIHPNKNEYELHSKICSFQYEESEQFLVDARLWLTKIENANKITGKHNHILLMKELSRFWWLICKNASCLGIKAWRYYWADSITVYYKLNIRQKLIFLIRCIILYSKDQDKNIIAINRFFK